jgi:hypothetical protein
MSAMPSIKSGAHGWRVAVFGSGRPPRAIIAGATDNGYWRHAVGKYLGQQVLRARVRAVFA